MPIDQKRINGPEGSFSYNTFKKENEWTFDEKYTKLFKKDGIRVDGGRKNDESRKFYMKLGVISTAKGSAYVELGNTKVIVSVFDPREIPKQNKYCERGELYCDFKYSPFSGKVRRLLQTDQEEKSLAQALKGALQSSVCRHLFSNFQVDIFANVLEDDGSVLSVAITAAGLALTDASVPMFDVITAATIGILGNDIIVDPTAKEEELCLHGNDKDSHGTIIMARLYTLEQITEFRLTGHVKETDLLNSASNVLVNLNKEIAPIVQQTLVTKIQKNITEIVLDDEDEENEEINDTN